MSKPELPTNSMALHERHVRGSQAQRGLPPSDNTAKGSSKTLELLKDNTGGSTRVQEVRTHEPSSFSTNEVSLVGHPSTTARRSSSNSKTTGGHKESRSNASGQAKSETAPRYGRPIVLEGEASRLAIKQQQREEFEQSARQPKRQHWRFYPSS